MVTEMDRYIATYMPYITFEMELEKGTEEYEREMIDFLCKPVPRICSKCEDKGYLFGLATIGYCKNCKDETSISEVLCGKCSHIEERCFMCGEKASNTSSLFKKIWNCGFISKRRNEVHFIWG